ncbi:ABC transporter ATP-binding protein/permease [Brevibacillus ruminantium]|uniref:ABC transporter ATP-binding protein/permease n=2 Tax=Brevibacillus ruminantium TaxID=2950604 RepID=A0ABY4WML8_9BACL|nr:ABC transporter ATP-binding protein [Brevibacillus ruminantium]USG68298.1 ABC transporter ATP-binding protein/permease [Brevibacillus ruminantium]
MRGAGASIGMGRGRMPGMGPKVKAKNTNKTLIRIWSYLAEQRRKLVLVFALSILCSGFALAGPYLIGKAIDAYILPGDYAGLAKLCLGLVAIYLFSSLMSWLQSYVMSGVTQQTVWKLRKDLFSRYQQLSIRFFDSRQHGELMSRMTNDIDNVSNTLNQNVIQLAMSLITITGSLIIMLSLNVWLTLVSLISIPLVILFTKLIASYTRNFFKGQQQQLGELNSFIEETISGQKVVKLFCRESISTEQFQEINNKLKRVGNQAQILSGLFGPVMNVVNNLSFALLAAVGGWMAFNGWTSVGIIVSFLHYSKQFGRPINELANQYNLIQSTIAGAERVFEILDLDSEFSDDTKPQSGQPIKGEVSFDRVSFGYQAEVPVLHDVTFAAKPGEMIALVGPTGTGKTTIVNLLTRFYEIDQGAILIDGQDIRTMDKRYLRKQLAIVLQDAYLFAGTIRENIRFGRLDATDEEVEAAARLANADSFIKKLSRGYETMLTAEGSNLSHGQRQLLTIARAILADPAILILDEATSNVDTRTEMHIQTAMKNLMRGRTSFVIAHRLSTIREADQILVMNEGRIIERGRHETLLEQKGFYHELYHSQFGRTEETGS